jgi:putative ABC transport system permease protein
MLFNYLKIAWRNISKRRFYSLLNIVGLGTGIVFTLLIGAYVWRELQVNKKLNNAKNQYFLTSKWTDPNLGLEIITIGPIAKRLKEEYPSLVNNFYRWDGITSVVTKGDKHFREGIQLGDSTLLSMYGFELLHGDARTALIEPYSVVLTQDIANKYFGKTDVVGETIDIQSFGSTKHDFVVTGVLKDIPENSVINLNDENNNGLFIPANTYTYFPRGDMDSWFNYSIPSYVELKEGVTAKDLEQPLKKLIEDNAVDQRTKDMLKVVPVALTDYYLQKNNGLVKRMLYALSFVGLFILLMAIVNFINIAISNSSARIREIGVRKVLGGLRKQIIIQFLTESILLVLIATILALIAYPLLQPLFGQMVGKEIPSLSSFPLYFIAAPFALILLVGLLAGLYPAFVLSSLKSVDSLKGKLRSISEKVWLRKSLAGFQFIIAAIVMIAAFIISQQVSYFFSRGLGYDKDFVVASQVPRDWTPAGVRHMETVRNEFAKMPEVANVAMSYEIPNGMNGGQPPIYRFGGDSTQAVAMQSLVTDEYYPATYKLEMAAGSFYSTQGSFDSSKVVLNETAVQSLGWTAPAEAIGQKIAIPGVTGAQGAVFTVQGVVKDFHFNTMQQKIQPMLFSHPRAGGNYRYLSFRLHPGNISASIAAIENKWATLMPGTSFEYRFIDDVLKKLYKTEIQLKKASYTATVLSFVIVLLGVLGLVSLSIHKRTKEIGIRKVLGASLPSVIALFVKEFIWIIAVAGLIATPLAWYIMDNWLNDYAYRIPLGPAPFVFAIAVLAILTLVLIVLQTFRTSVASPVKSLRTE